MCRRPSAILAAFCVVWLIPAAPAAAHSLRFGVLRVVPTGAGAEVELRAGGSEGAPPNLAVRAEGCALNPDVPRVEGNLLVLRVRARCASPSTASLWVEGLDAEEVSIAARVERGEDDTFVFLEHDADRLPLAASATESVFPRYLRLGAEHIAAGFDHLVFVLLLALLASRRPRPLRTLLGAVTGFTVGHSVTLSLVALSAFRLPTAAVEVCIALSIVFLAADVVRGGEPTWTARHPGVAAACFGLLHGLGFAGALEEVGLPAADAPMALLGFNLGVECGQLGFVALLAAVAAAHHRAHVALPARGLAWMAGALAAGWTALRLGAL